MKLSKTERQIHRRMGAHCFNSAWDILDKKSISSEEELTMLHLAHSSRYHWGLVGGPRERAIADWQVSRVYAKINEPSLAMKFARSCLETSKEHGLSNQEENSYEALARAFATARDYSRARSYAERAQAKLDRLEIDDEDREILQGQLDDTRALIKAA